MATSNANFEKGLTCPSSNLLLSFITSTVSSEVATLIRAHLAGCEFCNAETMLLMHHSDVATPPRKTPELPMNLRILAESLMSQSKTFRRVRSARHGLLLSD